VTDNLTGLRRREPRGQAVPRRACSHAWDRPGQFFTACRTKASSRDCARFPSGAISSLAGILRVSQPDNDVCKKGLRTKRAGRLRGHTTGSLQTVRCMQKWRAAHQPDSVRHEWIRDALARLHAEQANSDRRFKRRGVGETSGNDSGGTRPLTGVVSAERQPGHDPPPDASGRTGVPKGQAAPRHPSRHAVGPTSPRLQRERACVEKVGRVNRLECSTPSRVPSAV
jgi:hypothetical protein